MTQLTHEERLAGDIEAMESRLQHLLATDPQFAADYAGARIEQALLIGDVEQLALFGGEA